MQYTNMVVDNFIKIFIVIMSNINQDIHFIRDFLTEVFNFRDDILDGSKHHGHAEKVSQSSSRAAGSFEKRGEGVAPLSLRLLKFCN